MAEKTLFERMSAINVNERTEKKGKLTYLSWAWAWSTFKHECPDATYEVNEDTIYADGSVMVATSVTAEGETHDMWLPVMDHRNNAIDNPTSRQISDARMRCLTKNLAMHGLGIYIYAGEDLPEEQADKEAEKTALKKHMGTVFNALLKYDAEPISVAFEECGYVSEQEDKEKMLRELIKQVNSKEKLDTIGKRVKQLQDEVEKSLNA